MSERHLVKLIVTPALGAADDVALSDFLTQVRATQVALEHSHGKLRDGLDIRIVGLSLNSPASITLEPRLTGVPFDELVSDFIRGAKAAILCGRAEVGFGRKFFDALKDLTSVLGKGVSKTALVVGDEEIDIGIEAKDKIEKLFEPDNLASGTIDGMLESVNIHNKINTCNLYPEIGAHRIKCKFTTSLFEAKVRPALGKYVQIYGDLKYRWREPFPHEASVADIEILADLSEFPKLADIIGMAPDATGGVLSEDFVRESRDEWS